VRNSTGSEKRPWHSLQVCPVCDVPGSSLARTTGAPKGPRTHAMSPPFKLWDVASGQVVHAFEEQADNAAFCIAFSPDGAL
jgi:hypothetical protein